MFVELKEELKESSTCIKQNVNKARFCYLLKILFIVCMTNKCFNRVE